MSAAEDYMKVYDRAKAAEARAAELETAVEEALRELGSATLANSPAVRATALLRVASKGTDLGNQ